jgi:hypothetical protein
MAVRVLPPLYLELLQHTLAVEAVVEMVVLE